jgi:hypothetical protein|tara:strand:+ start:1194 stop:1451 length:258 start_codon:yes stop_codon:yes gene_type:complete
MKYRNVYFDESNQKIRWTTSAPEGFVFSYEYVGKMTRVEFDLLIEILWDLYENDIIPFEMILLKFNEIRTFCDKLKEIIDDLQEE